VDPHSAARFGLGPIDQVAYVVEDLERSLPRYEAIFGPFEVGESPLPDCTIRGRRADCRLRLAVNRDGPVEIELIQVLEGEPPQAEHLRRHGEGLHHVRFRVDDLDARLEPLVAAGFEVLLFKRFGPGVAFAYVETPVELGSSVIELLQLP
jgi:catechol 2,3-dioxygenase-like lactoylglutathione lyase family enzyme